VGVDYLPPVDSQGGVVVKLALSGYVTWNYSPDDEPGVEFGCFSKEPLESLSGKGVK